MRSVFCLVLIVNQSAGFVAATLNVHSSVVVLKFWFLAVDESRKAVCLKRHLRIHV